MSDLYAVPWLGGFDDWAEWYLRVYRELFLPILHRSCDPEGMGRWIKVNTRTSRRTP